MHFVRYFKIVQGADSYGSLSSGQVGDAEAYFRSAFEDLVAAKVFLSPTMAQPLVVGQDTHFVTPYLIGDAAFPLQMHMMKLYAGDNLGEKELAFNRIFVRARRHI